MFTAISAVEAVPDTRAEADAVIPEHAFATPNAATKRPTRYAAAAATGVVLLGLLSPGIAAAQQNRISLPGDDRQAALAIPERNGAMVLSSQLPWPAPVGHRQPRQIDAPHDEGALERERQHQRLHEELNRKLIICRGC